MILIVIDIMPVIYLLEQITEHVKPVIRSPVSSFSFFFFLTPCMCIYTYICVCIPRIYHIYMYYDILYVRMRMYVCLSYVFVVYTCELIYEYLYDSDYISFCLVKCRGRHRNVRNDCVLVVSLRLSKK